MNGPPGAADPAGVLAALAGSVDPVLIGVRHHSPVLAAAVPALCERFEPDVVAVELPAEVQDWTGWLADDATEAPVALAVTDPAGRLGFYPFADFSPELAALRWAHARGVAVAAIDLPVARRPAPGPAGPAPPGPAPAVRGAEPRPWGGAVAARLGVEDGEELWDRLVEVASYGADPEAVRRAGLAVGWMHRRDAAAGPGVSEVDLARETWMRGRLAELAGDGRARVLAVVGSFHAAALVAEPLEWRAVDAGESAGGAPPAVSLVPYGFELLDSRSGYPAGIRDPVWQQRVWAAEGRPAGVAAALEELAVALCGRLRDDGHVAGVPDAREVVRVAQDLANLRALAAPGRRELLEAVTTALGQGETLGRARVLARAARACLVGTRRGTVTPLAPRSGLAVHVEEELVALRLPHAGKPGEVELRLDVRAPLDQRRHVALCRLRASGVVYGEELPVEGRAGVAPLSRRWRVAYQPATAATVELAGVHGPTLVQAAEGALRTARRRLAAADELTAAAQLALVAELAACSLPAALDEAIVRAGVELIPVAGLADLVALHDLMAAIGGGHIPGLGSHPLPREPSPATVLGAAVAAAEGLRHAADLDAADALGGLVRIVTGTAAAGSGVPAPGTARLAALVDDLVGEGPPPVSGAALGATLLLGRRSPASVGVTLSSWADAAASPSDRAAPARAAGRLAGFLRVASSLLEASSDLLGPLADRVESWDDDRFLSGLPALREGFEAISPAARRRLLDTVAERLGHLDGDDLARGVIVEVDPTETGRRRAADLAGRRAAEDLLGSDLAPGRAAQGMTPRPDADHERPPPSTVGVMSSLDRWRLLLGQQREELTGRCRAASAALEDLYGRGRGEGSGAPRAGARGGGRERAFPTAREWAEQIESLFGARVREEVLARAVDRGRTDALALVDPDRVVPSAALLASVLSLAGWLPESRLVELRRLVERVVAELTAELASRMRPALTGLAVPRPTRRPVGPLDLRRTVAANLRTARLTDDGGVTLLPDDLVFRTRVRRSADWHVHLVVDVSGSMESSTVHAAVVAAIFAGLPALSVRFTAFSTEVVDLSEHVADPLSLLLEVRVGGGTDIGGALRVARDQLVVPSRTMVVVVSDFEEGTSVGRLLEEVRALAAAGVALLGVAALDDAGAGPALNRAVAEQVVAAGMPVAALSPLELARWVGERIRG